MSGAGSIASGASPPEQPGTPIGPGHRRTVELRRQLRSHRASDDRESWSLAVMLSELDRLARPFDEQGDPTHVTASAVVVGPRGVVLLRHRKLHRWMQPGGHIEPGESPEEAARREALEETGLSLSPPPTGVELLHVDVHAAADGHRHLDVRYLLTAADDDPAPPPGESQDVAWFSWSEAEELADEALVGALAAARRVAR